MHAPGHTPTGWKDDPDGMIETQDVSIVFAGEEFPTQHLFRCNEKTVVPVTLCPGIGNRQNIFDYFGLSVACFPVSIPQHSCGYSVSLQ